MHRLLNTLFIAGLLAANASAIVTTKSNYTDPVYGTTINGIYEGVVQLQVGQPGIGTYSCSGALLSSGTQILTAAHCLSDLRGGATYGQVQLGSVVTAYFDNQGSAGIVASGFVVNPLWDISTLLGDLAIITLPSPAPLSAQRYDIYRNTDELGQVADIVGYGIRGTGNTGTATNYSSISGFGNQVKLHGQNRVDAFTVNPADIDVNFVVPGAFLLMDFDNGLSAQNYWGDLGQGDFEINTAPGDSGGPAFIGGKIAGVTSWGECTSADINLTRSAGGYCNSTNSTFGEIFGETRVSQYAAWIDGQTATPEPATYAMMLTALTLLTVVRRNYRALPGHNRPGVVAQF